MRIGSPTGVWDEVSGVSNQGLGWGWLGGAGWGVWDGVVGGGQDGGAGIGSGVGSGPGAKVPPPRGVSTRVVGGSHQVSGSDQDWGPLLMYTTSGLEGPKRAC